MAELNIIGKINCLVCGHESVLKMTKKGKPCYTCSNCSLQVFSRGEPSGQKMLLMVKKEAAAKVPALPVNVEPEKEAGGFLGGIW